LKILKRFNFKILIEKIRDVNYRQKDKILENETKHFGVLRGRKGELEKHEE